MLTTVLLWSNLFICSLFIHIKADIMNYAFISIHVVFFCLLCSALSLPYLITYSKEELHKLMCRQAGALGKLTMGISNSLQYTWWMSAILWNKQNELDFSRSAALCFNKPWLDQHIPHSSLHLRAFNFSVQTTTWNSREKWEEVESAFI